MNMRTMQASEVPALYAQTIEQGKGWGAEMPAQVEYMYVLEDEGQVLAIGGFHLHNLYAATASFGLTEAGNKKIVFIIRLLRDWLAQWMSQQGLRRIQAIINPEFAEAVRLAEHLGFVREGSLPGYLGARPADMWARVI